MKKEVKNCSTQKQLNDLAERTKKFALNKELKDLYDKIVPPVAVMQAVGQRMQEDVSQLKAIVEQYDQNLSMKANK